MTSFEFLYQFQQQQDLSHMSFKRNWIKFKQAISLLRNVLTNGTVCNSPYYLYNLLDLSIDNQSKHWIPLSYVIEEEVL